MITGRGAGPCRKVKSHMNNRITITALLVIILFGATSCNTANNDSLTNRTAFPLVSDSGSTDSLVVIQNLSENYMMVSTKHNDWVISLCGGGNIDFCYTDSNSIAIDSAYFDETGVSYVLPLYVKGSTFGAIEYYVIYRECYSCTYWYVYKLPFSNLVIRDVNEDGFSELITYEKSDSSVYSFKHGQLHDISNNILAETRRGSSSNAEKNIKR